MLHCRRKENHVHPLFVLPEKITTEQRNCKKTDDVKMYSEMILDTS